MQSIEFLPTPTEKKYPTINPKDAKEGYKLLSTLLLPWARKLVSLMIKYGEMNVTDILIKYSKEYRDYPEQSDISQWLQKLKRCDLVSCRRSGKWIYYEISESQIIRINKVSHALAHFFNPKINVYVRQH